MDDGREVVITGLGLVLPHGAGVAAADAVFRGERAVRLLPGMAGVPGASGAPVDDFTPPDGTQNLDRAVQFAVAAAEEAWAQAGLKTAALDAGRAAVVMSLSKGPILALEKWAAGAGRNGVSILDTMPDAAARVVARRFGAGGPAMSPVTACASGGHALVWGARLIARGVADVALVGAAEASLHPLVLGSYRRLGVLAESGADAAGSVRPFSATRRGFAIGEGAGVLVLESRVNAARRGARPLAYLRAWASGCHAQGIAEIEPDGESLARLIRIAMARGRIASHEVDYASAHGTATHANDLAEARAIRAALGTAAAGVSVSSTKAAHGHLLGAATAVELVLTVLAMGRGQIPPTANLTDPDPEVDLDCTPVTARNRPVRVALKLASGFGGQMLAVLLTGE